MKRYLLCTILVGNLVVGMKPPATNPIAETGGEVGDLSQYIQEDPHAMEKAQLLDRLTVEASQTVSGIERDKLNSIIDRLRRELNPSIPANVPIPAETKELDTIIEGMPAENVAAPSAPRIPDLLFTDEQIAAMPVDDFKRTFGQKEKIPTAAAIRMAQMKDLELQFKIATDKYVKENGPVDNLVSEMGLRAELDKVQNAVLAQQAATQVPVAQMDKAQIEALIKKNTGKMFPPGSEYLKALEARCKELKIRPYDKNAELPAAVELPTFDQISHMDKEQLLAFQEQLAAQEGKISVYIQSEITERLEELATIERANAELKTPEVVVAARALSPKKVHFDLPDSDGSGIARSSKPPVANVDKPLTPEEVGFLGDSPAEPAGSKQVKVAVHEDASSASDSDMPKLVAAATEPKEFTDANSKVITSVEGFTARELIKEEDIPAPLNKDNFEDALKPDENFKGSQGAQPAPEVKVGTDAVPTPIAPEADPLKVVQPMVVSAVPGNLKGDSSPRSPAPEERDTPLAQPAPLNPAELTDPETPSPAPAAAVTAQAPEKIITHAGDACATPTPIRQTQPEGDAPQVETYKIEIRDATVVPPCAPAQAPQEATPDTKGDAALAIKLTEEGQTPGGPTIPQLPLEPVANVNGKASQPVIPTAAPSSETPGRVGGINDLKAGEKEEDETPGGPDKDAKDEPKGKAKDSGSAPAQDQNQWTTMQKTFIAVGVAALVYTVTETAIAYKTIPEKEWKENSGFIKKARLVISKTWENVRKRPSQLGNLAKKAPAAGASLFEKVKAKGKAA